VTGGGRRAGVDMLRQGVDLALSPENQEGGSELGPSRRTAGLLLVALSVVFAISLSYSPADTGYISICIFKNLTGLPCPGCGLTHSFCALGKGRVASAFRFNAMGPPIFLLAAGFWLRSLAILLGRMKPVFAFDRIARGALLGRLVLGALGLYGIGRIIYIVAFAPQLIESRLPLLKLISTLGR